MPGDEGQKTERLISDDGAPELQNIRGHLEIVYSLLDIGHSSFFFLNIQCPMIKY